MFGECRVRHGKRKRGQKVKIWNYKEVGARAKFQRETDERADAAIDAIIRSDNCSLATDIVQSLLLDAKKASFKIRTVTQKKMSIYKSSVLG